MEAEYRIRIVADPGNSSSTLAQTAEDTKRIGTEAHEAAEETSKLGEAGDKTLEQLGSLRHAHHVIAGVGEIAKGGAEAVAGIGFEARFAAEALEGLIPGYGAIAIAATTVLALGAQLVAKQQEHNEKIEEAAQDTDDLKDAAADYKKEAEDTLKLLEKQEESEKRQGDLIKQKQDFEKSLMDFRKKASLEIARTDYLLGNKPGQSDEEQRRRKEQYELTRAGIEGKSDVDLANLAVQNRQQDLGQAQKNRDAQASLEKYFKDKIDAAQSETVTANNFLANERIRVEPIGNKGNRAVATVDGKHIDVEEEFENRIKALQAQYQELQSHLPRPGAADVYPQSTAVARKEMEELEKQIQKTESYLNQVHNAVQATPKYNEVKDDFTSAISKLEDKVSQSDQKIVELNKQVSLAEDNRRAAEDKAANDIIERTQQNALSNAKFDLAQSDKSAVAESKAKIDTLQIVVDDKSRPAPQRQEAAKAIQELIAEEFDRKRTEGTAPGASVPLTQGEIDELKAQAAKARSEGPEKAAAIAKTETTKDTAADRKDVEQLKSEIEATGNKALIAQMKQLVLQDAGNIHQLLAALIALVQAHNTGSLQPQILPGISPTVTAPPPVPLSPQADYDAWKRAQNNAPVPTTPPMAAPPPIPPAAPTPPLALQPQVLPPIVPATPAPSHRPRRQPEPVAPPYAQPPFAPAPQPLPLPPARPRVVAAPSPIESAPVAPTPTRPAAPPPPLPIPIQKLQEDGERREVEQLKAQLAALKITPKTESTDVGQQLNELRAQLKQAQMARGDKPAVDPARPHVGTPSADSGKPGQEPPAAASTPKPKPDAPALLQGSAKKPQPDHHDDSADSMHQAAGAIATAGRSISANATATRAVTEQATKLADTVTKLAMAQALANQKFSSGLAKANAAIDSLKSNHQS